MAKKAFAVAVFALIAAGLMYGQSKYRNASEIVNGYQSVAKRFDDLVKKTNNPASFGKSSLEGEVSSLQNDLTALGNDHTYFVTHGGTFTSEQQSKIKGAADAIARAGQKFADNLKKMN